ncbi:hypothetical protein AGMMS49525_06270 [Bacteroidia bacterium]|nr:hypothetical protein AGMMS49525_06270 [Bacteroidia bacterium]
MTGSTTMAPSVTAINNALAGKIGNDTELALTGDVRSASTTLTTGTIATTLSNSGVSADTYGTNSAVGETPAMGATFRVPGFEVDAKGRIISASTHNVRMPDAVPTSILSGTIADANLADVGSAGNYGPPASTTLAYSGTFLVPYITTDTKGRVTSSGIRSLTLPPEANNLPSGTLSVTGTPTAVLGGITTTTSAVYTAGGDITVEAHVPLATATTAGAMPPDMFDKLAEMLSPRDFQ